MLECAPQYSRPNVKGTEIRFGSCRTPIFMEQPAKTIAAFHNHCWRGGESFSRRSAVRRLEVQAAVRPKPIVMIDENGQHALEMPRAQDQYPVQTLRPSRPHEAFRDSICLRHLNGRPNNPPALGLKNGIEAGREFAIVVANQKT